MCTLAVDLQSWPGFPVVVAANRDENLSRPSSGPAIWERTVRFIAPRDEKAGGTWLGLNASGVFVGITNRFGMTTDRSRRSRGELVLKALEQTSAHAAAEALSALDATQYNGFHLVMADRAGGAVLWSEGTRLTRETLGRGLHIVTERSFGAADTPRADLLRAAWPEPRPAMQRALRPLLVRHDAADPFRATCVHAPEFDYGTRSSLILGVAARPAESCFLWAEGAPCTHAHVAQEALVKALVEPTAPPHADAS